MRTDQIHIRGLSLLAPHGVYDEERKEGRQFRVDLDAHVPVAVAGEQDALPKTVDYRILSEAILRVLNGPSKNLIESLATEIVQEVFASAPSVERVRVTVWKRALGVPGDPEQVGVTLDRQRSSGTASPAR